MKKNQILMIAGIVIIIIAIVGGIVFISSQNNKTQNLIEISGKELLEKLENKETFIFVRTQDGCSHCEEYKPILNRVLVENNIYAYVLNNTKLKKEEESIQNEINKLFNISGTPTTIFINDGEEQTTINRLTGTSSYQTVKSKLKERGFIN